MPGSSSPDFAWPCGVGAAIRPARHSFRRGRRLRSSRRSISTFSATGQYCCYAEAVRPLEYVLSDARTGEVIGPTAGVDGPPLELAARPDGTLLYLKEAERDRPVGTLAIPSDRGAIEIEGVRSADW